MLIVTEETCRQVVTRADGFKAVEAVFSAMSAGDAYNFPVVREAIGYADALYGFKSGFDRAGLALGVKSGGYWPGNVEKGLSNHQSTIFLFDPDTGRLHALVGGNYLTAIRTAAASAVSIAGTQKPSPWSAPGTNRHSSCAQPWSNVSLKMSSAGTFTRINFLLLARSRRNAICLLKL